MRSNIHKIMLINCLLLLVFGCKSVQKEYDDEDGGIPNDIRALMKTIPDFHPDRDLYGISTISGWFFDEEKNTYFGLIEAETVNFEWETYQGTKKETLYRNFAAEKKYSDYQEWLKDLNRRSNLVTVSINPNTRNASLLISTHLNFPVKFSYKLEFDDQIIFDYSNDECRGSELIDSDLIEEEGTYKIIYILDGFESSTSFRKRK